MKLYGVFATVNGERRFSLFRNGRFAIRIARRHQGYVMATALHAFDGGDQYGIDAPTFRAVADPVADFRGPCHPELVEM